MIKAARAFVFALVATVLALMGPVPSAYASEGTTSTVVDVAQWAMALAGALPFILVLSVVLFRRRGRRAEADPADEERTSG